MKINTLTREISSHLPNPGLAAPASKLLPSRKLDGLLYSKYQIQEKLLVNIDKQYTLTKWTGLQQFNLWEDPPINNFSTHTSLAFSTSLLNISTQPRTKNHQISEEESHAKDREKKNEQKKR